MSPSSPTIVGSAAKPAVLGGWGGGPGTTCSVLAPARVGAVRKALEAAANHGAIARGMGRSYGDAAQLAGGLVLDMTRLADFELDAASRTVTAQAGVTIGALLRELVPRGWTLPVVPGTQHVTIGGAIASDIHGKSHGVDGTFGSHVSALGLLTADGQVFELAPGSDLFAATLGGMGLTGVIVWARIALAPIGSPLVAVDTDRAADLEEALALLASPGGRYRVAWLDLLGAGGRGRGVVTRAEHLTSGSAGAERPSMGAIVSARAAVPARWPAGALRPGTVRAFNELRFRRSPKRARGVAEPFARHMFPLDALEHWPRLYGSRGFLQYQFVVPVGSESILMRASRHLRSASVPCYLAVLKDFGPANGAPLSFPIQGWTLALDVPRAAPGLDRALSDLDELVSEAGGRVYLTKDARLRPDALAAMYPRLDEWRAIRDRADPDALWRSDLALRTGLVRR